MTLTNIRRRLKKMNSRKFDLILGIFIQVLSIGLMILSPWLYLVALIIGMNLAIGNLRHLYNKKLKRKKD